MSVYLKPNVILEPLFNQWYAWSYLIFPATAARYITQSHFKVMQSFVDAPQVHSSALKNPAMMGGPFINYGTDRVYEIKALLEKTKEEQAHMVQLSQAIADLDAMLTTEAKGYSLEPLYQTVPEPLKGYVELVYDANNNPSIRFIEGLLYQSPYYNPTSQTIALYLGHEDERSFVLSTPRLENDYYLHLDLPFNDSRLDRLFQMRDIPQPYVQIKNLLAIAEQHEPLFSSFFTEEPPPKEPKYRGHSVRVRYFGHACVLIETKDVSILCDPLVSYQHQAGLPRYTYADLPETIDYALITHNHQDHCMFETLLQLRHKIKHIVVPKSNSGTLLDPSLKLLLKTIGFANVIEIDNLESIDINDGQIIALPFLGEHGDLNISAKAAFLIQLKGQSILCLADSNNIEPRLYEKIHQLFGDVDLIFIGMECDGAPFSWAYGSLLMKSIPRKMDATRRLDGSNAQKAIELVSQFNPQQVYVYAMGQEPWLTYITSIHYTEKSRPIIESDRLVQACRSRNILSERLLGSKEILLDESLKRSPTLVFSKSSGEQFSEKPAFQTTAFQTTVFQTTASQTTAFQTTASQTTAFQTTAFQTTASQTTAFQTTAFQTTASQTIDKFLAKLSRLDIKLWVEDDRLRCNAPKGVLTATLKTQLRDRKPEILEFLSHKSNDSKTLALLNADAVLDASIYPESSTLPTTEPQRILLTGATGFVGAFLLHELLQQTRADIYCLVRAESAQSALNKLKKHLKSYLLWDDTFQARIFPVVGDLSQPLLGLSDQQFHQLASEIDTIYHSGAWVHHASPYSALKAANVLGTQEVLRLACQRKPKPFHFMSASSVFSGVGYSGVRIVREQDDIDDGQVPLGGYNQSKWVSEKLVKVAGDRGLPICIYRLGRISGHSQTGVFNTNDFLYRLIIGCVQLGSIPDGELMQDIIPVDYASQAVVHLSRQPVSWGKAFHLVQPHPVSINLFFDKLRSLGYSIQKLPYERWHTQLLNIAEHSPNHALYPLVSLLPAKNSQVPSTESAVLKFDCQNTTNGLANTSITCPEIDEQLLSIYFSYLIYSGALAPSPSMNNELKEAV